MIDTQAPEFNADAYYKKDIQKINLADYKGKWVILFFYPADFTFVCPTELEEMADHYKEFQDLDVEVLSVSTDTAFVHKAWHDHSPAIKKIEFPMVADPTGKICKDYGVYIEDEGLALRGTFLIDPEGVVRALEINNNSIGRSAKELVRKVHAAQFVNKHGGNVCPASWEPGKDTLKPGVDLIGKI